MMWSIEYSERAMKQLRKLDPQVRNFILSWINKNLIGTDNPRSKGKGLTENLSGRWRYRIGDYRVLARISESTITILVLDVGHRSEIY
jgi:mRNA interferase RelE/StbE